LTTLDKLMPPPLVDLPVRGRPGLAVWGLLASREVEVDPERTLAASAD